MSPTVIRFPPRCMAAIFICEERSGNGWLAIAGAHGWLCGSLAEARAVARWLSHNFGLPVREAAT
jgi:hypothetical protein